MDSILTRNPMATLAAVVLLQVLGLAVQIKRPTESGPTRLIRVWVINAVAPLEKLVVHSEQAVAGVWHGYLNLHGARRESEELRREVERLRLEQVRLNEDAAQGRRLQA